MKGRKEEQRRRGRREREDQRKEERGEKERDGRREILKISATNSLSSLQFSASSKTDTLLAIFPPLGSSHPLFHVYNDVHTVSNSSKSKGLLFYEVNIDFPSWRQFFSLFCASKALFFFCTWTSTQGLIALARQAPNTLFLTLL